MQGLIDLVLQGITVEDAEGRKVIEETLANCEKQPKFFAALQEILNQAEVSSDVRLGALSLMKNTMKNYWKKEEGKDYVIPDEEKGEIRRDLFMLLLGHQEHQITNSIALMIVFVIQEDFPDVWTTAITDVMSLITQPETALKGMLLLFQTVKVLIKVPDELEEDDEEQSTLREKRSKLGELHADQMFALLTPIWVKFHCEMLTFLSNFLQGTLPADQIAMTPGLYTKLALQSLRLIFYRFLAQLNPTNVPLFFGQLSSLLVSSVQCQNSLQSLGEKGETPLNSFLNTSILLMMKLLNECCGHSPMLFVPHMEPFLAFSIEELKKGYDAELNENYLLKVTLFLTTCLSIKDFEPDIDEDLSEADQKNNEDEVAEKIKMGKALLSNYFSEENMKNLFEVATFKYLRLNREKIEEWDDDPEEFLVNQLTENYNHNLYPAAEYLITMMLRYSKQFRAIASQCIFHALPKLLSSPMDDNNILLIDSAYNVFALFGNELKSKCANFRSIFKNYICPNFSREYPKILKRRVTQIIQNWSTEIYESKFEVVALDILLECFNEKDVITRVYAALALKSMYDNFDFKKPDLQRFIEPSFGAIVSLVDDMEDSTATTYILEIISTVITKLREAVRPYTQDILNKIFDLWRSSDEKSSILVKAACIDIIASLIAALVGCAIELEPVFLPLLQQTLNMSSYQMNNELLCLEASLALWWTSIQHAPFLTPDVQNLFPCLENILEESVDYSTIYKRGLRVIQAYVLTGKAPFLKTHLETIRSCLTKGLNHYYSNPILIASIDVMQTMIRMFPNDSPKYLSSQLTQLLRVVLNPDCPKSQYLKFNACAEGIVLFFDILILNPQFFFEFMLVPLEGINEPPLMCLLRVALKDVAPLSLDSINQERLFVMGLATLLLVTEPYIVQNTLQIVDKCLVFVKDIRQKIKKQNPDDAWLPKNRMDHNCPGYRALESLTKAHISNSTNEGMFLMQKISECVSTFGPQWENELRNSLNENQMKLFTIISTIKPKQKIG